MARAKKELKKITVLRQADMLDMLDSLEEGLNSHKKKYSKDYCMGYLSGIGIARNLCIHLAFETIEVDEEDLKQ